jgi:hypothetical protein
MEGTLAQLVEHRTENPGVPGSIPGGTTKQKPRFLGAFFFPLSPYFVNLLNDRHFTIVSQTGENSNCIGST